MKKSITIISSLAIAAAAFVGCQQIEENVPSGNAVTLNFAAETVDPASTKATLTPNEGETAFAAAWEKDTDAIGIYALVGEDYTENVEGIYNGSAFSANIKGTVGDDAIFSAAYPYSADGVIEFGQVRKQNGSIYNSAYDVMFADDVIGTLAQDATISLPMYRQSAIAYFHFTGDLSESETVQSASLTVTGKGENDLIAGGYMYDDSGIEPVGEAGSITISFENGTNPSVNDFTLWFNVIPVEYTALKLEVETENYTLTVNNSTAGTYVAGKLYKVSADASAKWLGKTKNVASFSINGVIDENNNKEFAGNEIITFPEIVAPEGKTFVGWSTEAITGTLATAPTTMVTPGEERMGLENATYYAVFATESGSTDPVLNQTLQYDTWTYYGSTTNKSSQSYRLFHSGSYIESAAFDLSTLSKVIVYGGSFGGASYNALTIGDGTNTWKSVTVSGSSQTGKNEYTGGTALSGTGKLRITSNSGTATSTGVRISKIEIFVQGEISYSDYCTTVATLSSISVKTAPTKVTYTEGEKFNPSGLVITRNYSDNTSDDYAYAGHESEFSFDPSTDTELTTSTTSVTITYKGMTANQAITVNAIPALETMDEIFTAATAAGSTAVSKKIKFNNWIVTGVKDSNAYLTDGTKGCIIFTSGHGFEAGDVLSGTVNNLDVLLYKGASEIKGLKSTSTGLTVTKGGTVTVNQVGIADLSGINTGSVISLSAVQYNGSVFTDGTNTITPYNAIMSTLPGFTNGQKYNVTGVYVQFGDTKEIAPRSGADIEVYVAPSYTITIDNNIPHGQISANATEAQEGVEVTLSATPDENYRLAGWNVKDADNTAITVTNNKFTMPAKAVTVSATFEVIPPFLTATPDKTEISAAGGTVTITVDTNIDNWTVGSSDETNFGVSKNGNTATVTVSQYDGTESDRKATITVSATGVASVEINILQKKKSTDPVDPVGTKYLDIDFSDWSTWSTDAASSLTTESNTITCNNERIYKQKGCLKIGYGTATNNVVSLPSLSSMTDNECDVTLTFKAVSSVSAYTLTITATNGTVGALTPETITKYSTSINNGSQTEGALIAAFGQSTANFSVTISGATKNTVISISAGSAKQWFLDDIVVTKTN